jgi:serine/threonine-protein kinase
MDARTPLSPSLALAVTGRPLPRETTQGDPLVKDDGSPRVGDVVAGRYRIEAQLGRGAMGAVFAAHDALFDRPVAIKILHGAHADHPTLPTRFEREAFAAARLDHPNCVQVFDAGRDDAVGQYLVMPRLEGHPLGALMQGPLGVERTVGVILQVLAGLDHAHARGFVHRDIKPDNLFVARDREGREHVTIVDFGLVKFTQLPAGRALTRLGSVFGTPAYMAPEQASGGHVDARADLYALGATMYEMLSGRPPFEADSFPAILRQHLLSEPDPLPPHVPAAIADFVRWLMAKDPAERPADAGCAAAQLRRASTPGAAVSHRAPPANATFDPALHSQLALAPASRGRQSMDLPAYDERPPSNLVGSPWPGRVLALSLAVAAVAVGWVVAAPALTSDSAATGSLTTASIGAALPTSAHAPELAEPLSSALAPARTADEVDPSDLAPEPVVVASVDPPAVAKAPATPAKAKPKPKASSKPTVAPRATDAPRATPVVDAPPRPSEPTRVLTATRPPRRASKLPGTNFVEVRGSGAVLRPRS